jgi:hypothetical protein
MTLGIDDDTGYACLRHTGNAEHGKKRKSNRFDFHRPESCEADKGTILEKKFP